MLMEETSVVDFEPGLHLARSTGIHDVLATEYDDRWLLLGTEPRDHCTGISKKVRPDGAAGSEYVLFDMRTGRFDLYEDEPSQRAAAFARGFRRTAKAVPHLLLNSSASPISRPSGPRM